MFPMRDHLYELAKLHEIELMQEARRRQQLEQLKSHDYDMWSLDPIRRLWQKLFRRRNPSNLGSDMRSNMPPAGAFEG